MAYNQIGGLGFFLGGERVVLGKEQGLKLIVEKNKIK